MMKMICKCMYPFVVYVYKILKVNYALKVMIQDSCNLDVLFLTMFLFKRHQCITLHAIIRGLYMYRLHKIPLSSL